MNHNVVSTLRRAIVFLALLVFFGDGSILKGQTAEDITLKTGEQFQTVEGFGASLAYYENWLNAHSKKAEIYEAIFGELSLDILRVRTAYEYDPGMVDRVKEYMDGAELSLGHPIKLMACSWGPPAYLKNTGDRKNGGSLRYDIINEEVHFDYKGFSDWWAGALDEYAAHDLYPTYMTLQNEPNYADTWETCEFNPTETITSEDTIAGYNVALDSIWEMLEGRSHRPLLLGPEPVGIGYNNVQNYVNNLDIDKLDGLSHHLYHGVDADNPWASENFKTLGAFHPEVPHFQTEFSRGDWFSLAGLIYKSFYDEKTVAYLYWDLIWSDGGLVDLDNPWQSSGWQRTKDFYSFKQFSAFVHPGWKMIGYTATGTTTTSLAFMSPGMDSATCIIINTSNSEELDMSMHIPGYVVDSSVVYVTSETQNCELQGSLQDSLARIGTRSIVTVAMTLEAWDPDKDYEAPSIPTGLSGKDVGEHELTLCWEPSLDNVAVDHYLIWMAGQAAVETTDTFAVFNDLEPMTTYAFQVAAVDASANRSELSEILSLTTLYFDRTPPILTAGDSIYQEGELELQSNEDGRVYLVGSGTVAELELIRELSLDSAEVEADVVSSVVISGLENGEYWLYATDSALNLSDPAIFGMHGVRVEEETKLMTGVWPNPARDLVRLSFEMRKAGRAEIRILDLQGRILRSESSIELTAGEQILELERRGLPAGPYMLQLHLNGEHENMLLIFRD